MRWLLDLGPSEKTPVYRGQIHKIPQKKNLKKIKKICFFVVFFEEIDYIISIMNKDIIKWAVENEEKVAVAAKIMLKQKELVNRYRSIVGKMNDNLSSLGTKTG